MKKMFKNFVAVVAIVLVISTVLVSCGGTSIVGKWTNSVNGVEVIGFTFTEDKMSVSTAGITTFECDYKLEDGKIVYTLSGIEAEIPYSIDGKKLTLEYMNTSYTLEKTK